HQQAARPGADGQWIAGEGRGHHAQEVLDLLGDELPGVVEGADLLEAVERVAQLETDALRQPGQEPARDRGRSRVVGTAHRDRLERVDMGRAGIDHLAVWADTARVPSPWRTNGLRHPGRHPAAAT